MTVSMTDGASPRAAGAHRVVRGGAAPGALLAAVLVSVFAANFADAAPASDASGWIGDARAEIRLVAGAAAADGTLRAGAQIRLAPGWKTYWRYPGDAGVPPVFDFTRSDNVQSVGLSWPAPHRFSDVEGVTIGYGERVLFPLRIVPKDAERPVVLRLHLDYAVCEKLCVPAQGQVELTIAPGGSRGEQSDAIAAAERMVPKPRALGANTALAVKSFRRDETGKPARILIDIAAPEGTTPEVFVEGPTPDWALPLPQPVAGAPQGLHRFAFALDGLPPGATPKGAILTVTAAAGDAAIETSLHLD
jgi:DsbC/DsbD-like thiol-disulfide interchange protein